MTRARIPRPHEIAAARRDPRLLRAIAERHDKTWRARGTCNSVDPETFFPAPLEPADTAIALCGRCPVAGACLAWALNAGDCHGVWGGTTARERRAMLVAWRMDQAGEDFAKVQGMEPDAGADQAPRPPRRADHNIAQSPELRSRVAAADMKTRIPRQRPGSGFEAIRDEPVDLSDTPLMNREFVHAG